MTDRGATMATRIDRAVHGKRIRSFIERGLLCRQRVLDGGIDFQRTARTSCGR